MSRAACSAIVASLACSEPTCLCASPLRLRMKTSHSGVLGVDIVISLFGSLRRLTMRALRGISRGRLAHPCAIVMRFAPRRDTIAVARPVAGEHLLEFGPVNLAVAPVAVRILRHAGVWNGEAEILRLRYRRIDEFLAQLVVGEALDLPLRRGVAVLAAGIGWTEHHQYRPPPPVQRVLRHRLLLVGAAAER